MLLESIDKILFVSSYLKDQFLKILASKTQIKLRWYTCGVKKENNFPLKKNIIIFAGKLNTSKGYDIFGKAALRILKIHKKWTVEVVGDEPREKIVFSHARFKNLGWLKYADTIKRIRKSLNKRNPF